MAPAALPLNAGTGWLSPTISGAGALGFGYNKDLLAQGQPLFKGMQIDRMFTDIDVTYHEGAIAFFREKGIKEVK